MSLLPCPPGRLLWKKSKCPSGERLGPPSTPGLLMPCPRLTGVSQGVWCEARRDTHRSTPPWPPGRSEAKYRLRPSGDSAGDWAGLGTLIGGPRFTGWGHVERWPLVTSNSTLGASLATGTGFSHPAGPSDTSTMILRQSDAFMAYPPSVVMSHDDQSAPKVIVGPEPVVVRIPTGRGDQDRVDPEFDTVDRVAGEIRAWGGPLHEETRFVGCAAPPTGRRCDRLIRPVGEERRKRREVGIIVQLRDPYGAFVPIPDRHLLEQRIVRCQAGVRTGRAHAQREPHGRDDLGGSPTEGHRYGGEDVRRRWVGRRIRGVVTAGEQPA